MAVIISPKYHFLAISEEGNTFAIAKQKRKQ